MTDKKYASVAVVCRQLGDDEDSISIYPDSTTEAAIEKAREEVMTDEDLDEDAFILNAVMTSDSPITGTFNY